MKLLSWGATNLFGYEKFDIDLSSLGRTILLDGVNKDFASRSSNGAGKSSVIETLCWVLFGQTLRGVETKSGRDAVIRDESNEGAHAYVRVLVRDSSFEIHRYRANKAYKNEVRIQSDGKDVTKRYSRDTEAAIRNLLGFNYDVFKRAVVMHSWATESFRDLNDRYLKYITERLVGMPDMDGLCKTVSESVLTIGNTVDRLQFEIGNLERDLVSKRKDLEAIKALEKDYSLKRAKELQEKLQVINSNIESWTKDIQTQIESYERYRIEMEAATKHIKELDNKLNEASEALRAANETHNEHLVTEKTNKIILKKYKDMKDATICPECNQPVGKHHIEQLISLHQTAYNSSKKQSSESEAKLLSANRMDDKVRESINIAKSGLVELSNTFSYIEGKRIDLQEKIEIAKEEKRELQSELKDKKSNPFAELLEKASKELGKLKTDQEEKKVRLSKKERTKQYFDFWKVGFGPDGMRAYLLDSVTPDLNRLANIYLQELTDGTVSVELSTVSARKDGTYKDKFSVTIDNSIGSRYFAGNSDGEIACLDLALNFAMSDVLESRLDGGLGILYIDQALDLVDPVRGDKGITLLNRRTDKEWCSEIGLRPKDHVFVITHRQEFKDRFESTVFVEKENGLCRIVS